MRGTISLDGSPPLSGAVVQLVSDHPTIATVPAQVTMTGFAPSVDFVITTHLPPHETMAAITAT